MYLDSAYIAKLYVNEVDSVKVRDLVRAAKRRVSSALVLAEVACAFHRHLREGDLDEEGFEIVTSEFQKHVRSEVWELIPITESLLNRTFNLIKALPPTVPLRAGDAIHLASVGESGEKEIWSNDRRLLAAASYFGVVGRIA